MGKKSKENQVIGKYVEDQALEELLQFQHEQRLRIYMDNPIVYLRRVLYPERDQFSLSSEEIETIEDYIETHYEVEIIKGQVIDEIEHPAPLFFMKNRDLSKYRNFNQNT